MDRRPDRKGERRGERRDGPRGPEARERRVQKRSPYRGWVELMVDGSRQLAQGVDLAPGGIGLRMRVAPPLDARATTEFALPGISLPLEVEGRVAWCDGAGRVGLRFEATDPGLAELLENYAHGRL